MELKEAFRFEKEILKMGKKKGCSVDEVRQNIRDYIDILLDERDITDEDSNVLLRVADKTSDILSGDITVDEVYSNVLSDIYEDKKKQTSQASTVRAIVSNNEPAFDCHRPVRKSNGCSITTDRCGFPVYTKSSSRCGSSSSSSSCGSSGSRGSRC